MPLASWMAVVKYDAVLEGLQRDGDAGYLVAGVGDLIRIVYVGADGDEEGWCYGQLVLAARSSSEGRAGWMPTWSVERMFPPGPPRPTLAMPPAPIGEAGSAETPAPSRRGLPCRASWA